MRRNTTAVRFQLITVLLMTLGVPRAWADIQTFTLGAASGDLAGLTGPYVTVTVNLTSSTTAAIEFDSLTNGGFIYMTADGQAVDMNVNATTFTASTPAGASSVSGFNPGGLTGYSQLGFGSVDGFGNFNLQFLDDTNNFAAAATSVTLGLTNNSGTWSSASDVLIANAAGNRLAAHVFACPDGTCKKNSTPTIGFASEVPEPRLLLLSGLALLALVLSTRLRSRNLENRNSR